MQEALSNEDKKVIETAFQQVKKELKTKSKNELIYTVWLLLVELNSAKQQLKHQTEQL